VKFIAGEDGARFIFYAGQPQRDEIISHGPFIGNTQDDIVRLYREYRAGGMKHVNDLDPALRVSHEGNIPV
jgi:redox-sensitive bicupin YhaK (pirin superfamily)